MLSTQAHLRPVDWLEFSLREFRCVIKKCNNKEFINMYNSWYQHFYDASILLNMFAESESKRVSPSDLVPNEWKEKFDEITSNSVKNSMSGDEKSKMVEKILNKYGGDLNGK